MRVLMISLDKGLLGKGELGDVVSRHRTYGQFVTRLDIIVFSKKGFKKNKISQNVRAFPTNSRTKLSYLYDTYMLGKGLFKDHKYQLVVTQAPFISGLVGYLLAKKYKAKLLIHYHGDYIKNREWRKEKWYNGLLIYISKFLSKRADGIRVMSEGIKNKLVESRINGDKIKVISTPVSLVKFGNWNDKEVQEIMLQYENKKIILFIGRLEKVKDLPTLLQALVGVKQEYKNFVVLVIGNGSARYDWETMSRKMDLEENVKFLGQIDHEDLVNYYKACTFNVNSSTNESFGKIFVEAAVTEKPSVATSTTGAQEIIIDYQTGLLSPVGDSKHLSSNILKLLQNDELRVKLGKQAKEQVSKRYDGGINTQEIIKFWQELIDPPSSQ